MSTQRVRKSLGASNSKTNNNKIRNMNYNNQTGSKTMMNNQNNKAWNTPNVSRGGPR